MKPYFRNDFGEGTSLRCPQFLYIYCGRKRTAITRAIAISPVTLNDIAELFWQQQPLREYAEKKWVEVVYERIEHYGHFFLCYLRKLVL